VYFILIVVEGCKRKIDRARNHNVQPGSISTRDQKMLNPGSQGISRPRELSKTWGIQDLDLGQSGVTKLRMNQVLVLVSLYEDDVRQVRIIFVFAPFGSLADMSHFWIGEIGTRLRSLGERGSPPDRISAHQITKPGRLLRAILRETKNYNDSLLCIDFHPKKRN
jgi:hypothetical protein